MAEGKQFDFGQWSLTLGILPRVGFELYVEYDRESAELRGLLTVVCFAMSLTYELPECVADRLHGEGNYTR